MKYGWIPDTPDFRDFSYEEEITTQYAPIVDLRPYCPPVYDQGQLGSCTSNALAANVEFDIIKQATETPYIPSRLFLYYNERVIERTVQYDAGASLRDGIKSLVKQGDCDEALWPYDINQFAVKPPATCYQNASTHKIKLYQRVPQQINKMQTCLSTEFPFVIGFTVYQSFEEGTVAQDGIVPMPKRGEAVLGGHAVLVVGYDLTTQYFTCRNSWGAGWGSGGYFFMPYAYLTNPGLAGDFWTVRFTA